MRRGVAPRSVGLDFKLQVIRFVGLNRPANQVVGNDGLRIASVSKAAQTGRARALVVVQHTPPLAPDVEPTCEYEVGFDKGMSLHSLG